MNAERQNTSQTSRRFFACCLVVLSFCLGRAALADQDCPLIVVVDGESALSTEVKGFLVERGIEVKEIDGCPSLQVRLERRDDGLWLGLTDLSGRTGERNVTEIETAAALIEAWARADLSAPLLLIRPLPTPASKPVAESEPSTRPTSTSAPSSQETTQPKEAKSRYLDASTEILSATFSVGAGLGIKGGVQLHNILLGGYIRGYTMIRNECDETCVAANPQGGVLDTKKRGGDVLFSMTAPLALRRTNLAVNAGVGLGWLRLLSAVSTVELKDKLRFGPRLDFGLEDSWAISQKISLVLGVNAGRSLLTEQISPDLGSPFELDPAPKSYLRGVIGVRVGGR